MPDPTETRKERRLREQREARARDEADLAEKLADDRPLPSFEAPALHKMNDDAAKPPVGDTRKRRR